MHRQQWHGIPWTALSSPGKGNLLLTPFNVAFNYFATMVISTYWWDLLCIFWETDIYWNFTWTLYSCDIRFVWGILKTLATMKNHRHPPTACPRRKYSIIYFMYPSSYLFAPNSSQMDRITSNILSSIRSRSSCLMGSSPCISTRPCFYLNLDPYLTKFSRNHLFLVKT